MAKRLAGFFLIIIFLFCYIYAIAEKNKTPAPLFNNLGKFHRAITTNSPLAQRYFDQGLVLFYSFEYGESIRSFEAAVKVDPKCAMCYWGLALALGSKTVTPLNGHELQDANKAIQLANKYVDPRNVEERAFIEALTRRYSSTPPKKLDVFAGLCSSYSQVSGDKAKDYADAMNKVVAIFPEDVDAKVLQAAALFDVAKWDFWTHQHQANPYTPEIMKILEQALKLDPDHLGANHLYVHVMEFSPYPERALPVAVRLNRQVPGSEHLAHMPSHTYFVTGRYHEATLANQRAINIFQKYAADCRAQGFEPEIQYLYFHNYDFLIATASMEGRKTLAITSAQDLYKQGDPLAKKDFTLQKMLTPAFLTLLQFGEWQKVLDYPKPSANNQYVLANWYYARALAEIQLNQMDAAKQDLQQLKKYADQGPVPQNLEKLGYNLLQIAVNTIEAELAYKAGQIDPMKKHFLAAIKEQDDLHSIDPPLWYVPVRQIYGAALLKVGKPTEAKQVFEQDLKMHPKNGWSLFGLIEAERALGQEAKAKEIDRQFKEAWKYADIKEPIFPV